MQRIVFLVSGGGGTMRFVHHALQVLTMDAKVVAVIADRNCKALTSARMLGIPGYKVKYSQKVPEYLQEALRRENPDIIVTNIHKILDAETLSLFPNAFLNLHYSLLPSFSGIIGMKTLDEAKALNVGFVGATCHAVSKQIDSGHILCQCCFSVDWTKDSMMSVTNGVFRGGCLCLLRGIVDRMKSIADVTNTAILSMDKTIYFNPDLSFNIDFCTEKFWDLVARNQ